MITVDWNSVPDATHYCPETDELFACFFKKDGNGEWLGKLHQYDDWGPNVTVDEHTLDNMISKEN